MAQDESIPQSFAQGIEDLVPAPLRKILSSKTGTPKSSSKSYVMNWKPEPNEEQKAEIAREQRPLTKKGVGKKTSVAKSKAKNGQRKAARKRY